MEKPVPRIGLGAVIWRGPKALLLVRRAKQPRLGEWSLPGGGVELGETIREALAREVAEETGLSIEIGELIDVADLIGPDVHYVLVDFSAHWREGEAMPDSDVSECAWFTPEDALRAVSWDETKRIIRLSAKRVWNINI